MNRLRMYATLFAILLVATALSLTYFGGPVHAASCPGSPSVPGGVYGRRWNCSYFNNTYGMYPNQYNWLLISQGATRYNGLTSNWSTTRITYTTFINSLHARVFDGTNIINASRASSIIDIMLGMQGTDFSSNVAGVNYARAHWTDFTNLVSAYDSHMTPGYSVDYNVFFDFSSVNSNGWGLYDPNPTSDFSCTTVTCYPDAIFATPFVDNSSDWAVVFYYPGGQFIIKDKCGNLTGDSDFPPMPPPPTATCAGFTSSVLIPDPNKSFNLKVSIRINPASFAAANFGPDMMSLSLTGPSPYAGFSSSTGAPSIVSGLVTMQATVPATHVSGTFNLTWQIAGSQAPTASCSGSVTVAYQPYLTVVGGDVSAGQGFGNSCIDNPSADIDGENLDDGSSPLNYFGSSTRNAAIATGKINQFATDTVDNVPSNLGGSSDGLSANQPGGLAIANNAVPAPSYGGKALGSWPGNWCVPDYVTNAGTPSGTFNPANLTSGIYTLSGSTIGGFTVPAGVHITVVASADVYINGDIKYASYNNLSQIPQFTLLVKGGDVYIDHGVKVLHGFYDTQPDSAAVGGRMFTCATALGAASTNYSTCNVPLTFYGAAASKLVIPGRTAGDTVPGGAVSTAPAEQFVYSPELWLGAVTVPTETCAQDRTQPSCMYVTYTNLPPTL